MGTVRYTVIDGEIIAEKRNGVRKQYVPDPLGSTVAMLDNTQTQTDTFSYWPYGEVASRTGSTATPFQFMGTAGCHQDSSNKNYMRARVLDMPKGRWLTEDPIGFNGDDWNVYRYIENNPTTYSDAAGLKKRDPRCDDASCGKQRCDRLIKNLDDVCKNRITNPVIRIYPDLTACLSRRCKNIRIICFPANVSHCQPAGQVYGYTPGLVGGFTNNIYICPPAFNPNSGGCLGKTITHEMLHSCGDVLGAGVDLGVTEHETECITQQTYGPGTPPCPD